VEEGELVDEDGAEGEALVGAEPLGWDRAMGVADAFDLLMEVFDGD